jgi:pyruvate,water dikinase
LDGIGASPGVITATARVMLDPQDDFEPGEVLFAKSVDPGWSPILACAGAIVLDSGGLMSHGAVVARELGIPCVAGVRSGTLLARSGRQVTVDGSAGTVSL